MSHRTLAVAALAAVPILPLTLHVDTAAAAEPTRAPSPHRALTPHRIHVLRQLAARHRRHLAHEASMSRRGLRDARAKVLAAAAGFRGVPYRYGGASRAGVDCSGLVVAVYWAALRRRLPRTVAGLRELARPVRAPLPGDLLFYDGEDHVAIVASVSRGRVTSTWVARHSGTVVQQQRPYAAYTVGTVI